MIRKEIKNNIITVIQKTFGDIGIPDFGLEVPENSEHGDYATNIALVLAKTLKKSPMEISTLLELGIRNQELWETKIAAPGFINFFISKKILSIELSEILKQKNKYGSGKRKREKIQLEFISANPTGPLTLANGRGGFLGDVLARVLTHQGYSVDREYYINDAGDQVRKLGLSVLAAAGKTPDSAEYYHGEHIKEWAEKNKKIIDENQALDIVLGRIVANDFLENLIKRSIKEKMGIEFNTWTSESEDIKYADKAFTIFRERGLTKKEDGAIWLKTTEFGDDKDRVLMTSEGFPTYFSLDAGHYLKTKETGFDLKINVLGADHHGYTSRIEAAAKIFGLESKIIIMQMVRLISGGKEMRMSKRKGNFITIDELIDEVGVDATRFFFLERAPNTHMDFDLDLAKEQSNKNPVYYVQYAHASISSILKKTRNTRYQLPVTSYQLLTQPEEHALIKKLIQFPEIVADTAQDFQVHRIPRYALELARTFHNFYEKCRVISKDKELTSARLALVNATQIVLKNTLDLLNIDAPKKM